MKTFKITTVATMVALALISTGCTSKQEAIALKKVETLDANNALNDLPMWYQNPNELGDKYAATGSAKVNKADDMEFQRVQAMAIARAELSRQTKTAVQDMYKRASQELGIGEDAVMDHAAQYATIQISKSVIEGSKQKRLYKDRTTGTLYVLMVTDETLVKAAVKSAVRSSFNNNDARWQQFQATQTWKELDSASETSLTKVVSQIEVSPNVEMIEPLTKN
jgi:hypothetical protein